MHESFSPTHEREHQKPGHRSGDEGRSDLYVQKRAGKGKVHGADCRRSGKAVFRRLNHGEE